VATNFRELHANCDSLIRAGDIERVQIILREINSADVPKEWRFPIANLCRRTGLVTLGLKILTPQNMMDRDEWLRQVSPAEVAEYALLLQRNGSVNEALKILDGVSADQFPDALLYRAYCHFNRWEYAEAIPALQKFVATIKDEYKKLIGQVNLAAAFVHTARYAEAQDLLESLKAVCTKADNRRLLANCHELTAQMYIAQFDLVRARGAIETSAGLLGRAQTLDQLFVRKLQAVSDAIETGIEAPLNIFRQEATERRDWESVRDSDLYLLKLGFDQSRFNHLIFGTPFEAYRQRVYNMLGQKPTQETYTYGDPNGPCLDLVTGRIQGTLIPTVGGKVHQLLDVLLKDLYRPKSLGVLFSELFPEEHFDVFSSSDRVHQILRRGRAWIRDSHLPIEIVEDHQFYSLVIKGSFGVHLKLNRGPVSWNDVHLTRLMDSISSDRYYGAKVLRQKLGMGLAPFRRFTAWALEYGHIERTGSGPATSYRLRTMRKFNQAA
jgi:tetratricopeptide (TPR) repeat protein